MSFDELKVLLRRLDEISEQLEIIHGEVMEYARSDRVRLEKVERVPLKDKQQMERKLVELQEQLDAANLRDKTYKESLLKEVGDLKVDLSEARALYQGFSDKLEKAVVEVGRRGERINQLQDELIVADTQHVKQVSQLKLELEKEQQAREQQNACWSEHCEQLKKEKADLLKTVSELKAGIQDVAAARDVLFSQLEVAKLDRITEMQLATDLRAEKDELLKKIKDLGVENKRMYDSYQDQKRLYDVLAERVRKLVNGLNVYVPK